MLVKIYDQWFNPELVTHIFESEGHICAGLGYSYIDLAPVGSVTLEDVAKEINACAKECHTFRVYENNVVGRR